MIKDKTIDEALIECMRTMKSLKALRKTRKQASTANIEWTYYDQHKEHAAATRASLDLTRKLADLRQGR